MTTIKPTTKTPLPYQSNAAKVGAAALIETGRALIDMATGLGKTFTSTLITAELAPKRILFLTHNLHILDHAKAEFEEAFPGMTTAYYAGVQKHGAKESDMVFATWQTLKRSKHRFKRDHFDLIIVDEAHHSEAPIWKPVVEYFKGMKLGLTATPDRMDQADIRSIFGNEVVKITLEEAIARGWLPNIEYHVITDTSLNDDMLARIAVEIKQARRRLSADEINRRLFITKRDEEVAAIINGYKQKTVVFCQSIRHANRMSPLLEKCDTFHSGRDHVRTLEIDDNRAVLRKLKSGKLMKVCAVNAFNEGVDVPDVEVVVFCRATNSITIFRQQLGRGLRPGKPKLVVLDFVSNLERIKQLMEMMNRVGELHERHTSEADRERERYSREQFSITGANFSFKFDDRIVDIMKELEVRHQPFYTLAEAKLAVKRLEIRNMPEYKKRYGEDPRLPASPAETYKTSWKGWPDLFGRGLSFDIVFIKRQIQRYKFKNIEDYTRRAKKLDPRLPVYAALFDRGYNWATLSGKIVGPTYTLKQLITVLKKAGVKTLIAYRLLRRNDKRIPASPHAYYKGRWSSAKVFGRSADKTRKLYQTCLQASLAAITLDIEGKVEYTKRYKEDPMLPSQPWSRYVDWPGWYVFLAKDIRNIRRKSRWDK